MVSLCGRNECGDYDVIAEMMRHQRNDSCAAFAWWVIDWRAPSRWNRLDRDETRYINRIRLPRKNQLCKQRTTLDRDTMTHKLCKQKIHYVACTTSSIYVSIGIILCLRQSSFWRPIKLENKSMFSFSNNFVNDDAGVEGAKIVRLTPLFNNKNGNQNPANMTISNFIILW